MFEIARNSPAGYRRDPVGNPEGQDVAAASLCALASAHGIQRGVLAAPGKHDWPFAAQAATGAAWSGRSRACHHERRRKLEKLHSFANSED